MSLGDIQIVHTLKKALLPALFNTFEKKNQIVWSVRFCRATLPIKKRAHYLNDPLCASLLLVLLLTNFIIFPFLIIDFYGVFRQYSHILHKQNINLKDWKNIIYRNDL